MSLQNYYDGCQSDCLVVFSIWNEEDRVEEL